MLSLTDIEVCEVPHFIGADLILIHPKSGVHILVEVLASPSNKDDKKLMTAVQQVEEILKSLDAVQVNGLFIAKKLEKKQIKDIYKNLTISKDELSSATFIQLLSSVDALEPHNCRDLIVAKLFPSRYMSLTQEITDIHAEKNLVTRNLLELNQSQSKPVLLNDCELITIEGGAGTGKTVIVLARAKRLATEFPMWKILIVCYNNALKDYLDSQAGEFENISVIAASTEVQIGYRDSITVRALNQKYDAILVDEAQDLIFGALSVIGRAVKPNRGGLLLAFDKPQDVYAAGSAPNRDLSRFIASYSDVKKFPQSQAYRGTKQTISVACAVTGVKPPDTGGLLEGEKVALVRAESKTQQSLFVANNISSLMKERKTLKLNEIAIVYRDKYFFDNNFYDNHLVRALKNKNVGYRYINAKSSYVTNSPDSEDQREDQLVITTVHSAKGKEFSVVFMIGLETYRSDSKPDAANFSTIEPSVETKNARLAYVAMTRAKDLLILVYSGDNSIIRALIGNSMVESLQWPADFGRSSRGSNL